MSDKKNEDFVVRMPGDGKEFDGEKDPFLARSNSHAARAPAPSHHLQDSLAGFRNSPIISVLAYCLASISMTVVNKYVVSGSEWNLNFLYLAIQVHLSTGSQP